MKNSRECDHEDHTEWVANDVTDASKGFSKVCMHCGTVVARS